MERTAAADGSSCREICDVYDIYGNKTDKTFVRGEPLGDGEFVMIVDIWIINKKKQILIQKRSKQKKDMPNTWATHSGCAKAGETAIEACIRECYEEIGIKLSASCLHKVNRKIRGKLLSENFIAEAEFDLSNAVLQEEEVSAIKWVSGQTLAKMLYKKDFYNYPELQDILSVVRPSPI